MDSNALIMVQSSTMHIVTASWEFEDLYRIEYPALVAVATAMTGSRRDGEDLVQDTMVKAFVHWPRVARLERPGGWCHRVLVNACRSRLRRRRTERRFLERARKHEATVAEPSADVLAFWAAVRTLPDRPRAVVTLHFAGDRSTAEIASILGCPEGTVRSDLSRARVVLADGLGL